MRTIAPLLPHCFHGNDPWKHSRTLHDKRCLSQVVSGAPEEIRTPDPQIRRLLRVAVSKTLFCKMPQFVGV
jgi:hypothetical protein